MLRQDAAQTGSGRVKISNTANIQQKKQRTL